MSVSRAASPLSRSYIRRLPIPEQTLLLFEFFPFGLVLSLHNQRIDVVQVPLGWNLKSGILFPDSVLSQM